MFIFNYNNFQIKLIVCYSKVELYQYLKNQVFIKFTSVHPNIMYYIVYIYN